MFTHYVLLLFKWAKSVNCKLGKQPESSTGLCLCQKEQELQFYKFTKYTWKYALQDYELLSVSFRQFYLPYEFGHVTVILFSVLGPNNKEAAEIIIDSFNVALSWSADQQFWGTHASCHLTSQLCSSMSPRPLDPTTFWIAALAIFWTHTRQCADSLLGKSNHNVIHLSQHTDRK